ncbi:YdeI/OmpD-associated family protein [Owenweeksia hongkongensis]|uniref:YdeI/OmpD-associated family protein n=1 Tax=Owenweeksia hongkongensis TaxID=253245 RepID=UPI003A8E9929
MAKPKNTDEYLARLEGNFAHPILTRVREVVLETAPQVEETIKWGAPTFEYKGIMLSMVAFKKFAAVWFHKGALFNDPKNLLEATAETTKSMRKYNVSSIEDLDEEGLRGLVLEAIEKNESGEQVEGFNQRDKKYDSSELLNEALKSNAVARKTFESLPPSHQHEYVEHIESAKQDATKQRRVEKALLLLEQGSGLHDKYRK